MDTRILSEAGTGATQTRPDRNEELNNTEKYGTIEAKAELWCQIIRQVVALMYLLAKLNLGYLPPEAKIGKRE